MPTKPATEGKCLLCLEDRKRVESHIFPEWIYRSLYNQKHFYTVVSFEQTRLGKRPIGIYEKLLCAECDNNKIQEYERYALGVFSGEESVSVQELEGAFIVEGVSYGRFKLFLLSLLWRVGISTRSEVSRINLGPHQEKIRRMLHEGRAGETHEYGCTAQLIMLPELEADKVVIMPEAVTIEGYRFFRYAFGGVMWLICTSSHSASFPYRQLFFTDSQLILAKQTPSVREYFTQMAKQLQTWNR